MSDSPDRPAHLDTSLPFADRARALVARMTLREKISQMLHASPPIPHLGIPAYTWWNECLHGVARAGVATVFPQAIGMAATFDTGRLRRVATAISDEARAKHHESQRRGDCSIYKGLTFWSPNINIFRDPRWGRGHETYGEDPHLTGRMGVTFIKALQGDDPRYLKLVATAKHYAVHSGPEAERHSFDSIVSPRDLRETYLPAFKAAVKEATVAAVMGAYNRTNGEPCCGSPTLLGRILRGEWGFQGHVVSDCWALRDFHQGHKVTATPQESAALALREGCDLNCGDLYHHLLTSVQEGLVTEADVDRALVRLFTARFQLGMFDPPAQVPYASIPYEVNACAEHRKLARDMARASLVLLKNEGGLLPLSPALASVAVIGPNADSLDVLLGNYHGTPGRYTTLREGIRAALPRGAELHYAEGCKLTDRFPRDAGIGPDDGIPEAVSAALRSEVAILCLGLSPRIEGEQGDAGASDSDGDRLTLDLPGCQQRLLEAVCATGKPVVLLLTAGSPVTLAWAAQHVPAILQCWYPGQEGGHAVADVLFGRYNPAGRLPVTFVRSMEQLPPFKDYAMKGRTYRFLEEEPLYRFGFGLSYTRFTYSALALSSSRITPRQSVKVSAVVTNSGSREGEEVVQLYVRDVEASVPVPRVQLRGFQRLRLKPGQSKTVRFTLKPDQLAAYADDGTPFVEPGDFEISVGGCQPGTPDGAWLTTTLTVG